MLFSTSNVRYCSLLPCSQRSKKSNKTGTSSPSADVTISMRLVESDAFSDNANSIRRALAALLPDVDSDVLKSLTKDGTISSVGLTAGSVAVVGLREPRVNDRLPRRPMPSVALDLLLFTLLLLLLLLALFFVFLLLLLTVLSFLFLAATAPFFLLPLPLLSADALSFLFFRLKNPIVFVCLCECVCVCV